MIRNSIACAALFSVSVTVWADAASITKGVDAAIIEADKAVARIVSTPKAKRTFENTILAIDDLSTKLDTSTSTLIFLQNVSTDAKEREAARNAETKLSGWSIKLGKREDLYRAVTEFGERKVKLSGEYGRLYLHIQRDYRLGGMTLPKAKRDQLAALENRVQKLEQDYNTNIYEDPTTIVLSPEDLKGVPEDVLAEIEKANGLYLVKPDGPTYSAILDYAENPVTRQRVWTTYKRRGGEKNVKLLESALQIRSQMAGLLGYANWVDSVAETRMAKNSRNIAKFYEELRPLVRKKAQQDYDEFLAAKQKDLGTNGDRLYSWDYAYYNRLLLKEKYAVDAQKVAEYFPLDQVSKGLFNVASTLYGVTFKDVTARAKQLGLQPVWHPDVKLWEVSDKSNGKLIGHIYTDLFPRENKYNHAACWGLRPRKVWANGTVQTPVAALVCNFTKPTADKPSLMTHDEVTTYFHEFGHGLHNLLTETKVGRFSGTSVALDFVEAPSQMFENWCWDPTVLAQFAKHYKTGEVLPAETISGMIRARTLGSGLDTEHQIYYGMVDQAYHLAKGGKIDTTKVGQDMLPQLELMPKPEGTFYQAAFGHLMGGYEGGYYGYLYSLVYAQDMQTRFTDKGILSPEAGAYYRKKILARGGSMDELDMLRDYLGREPNTAAFKKHLGLDTP
jgi:thimet oligopeptidase